MSDSNLAEFLASVELLSALSAEELSRLAGQASVTEHGFGDTLFEAGDEADGLYVVKSGIIRLFKQEEGKEISVGLRKEEQTFSELAILREHRHEYSARASGEAELLRIPRRALKEVLGRSPEAASFVTNYVAINSAGGLMSQLFDLRKRVNKDELEDLVRSLGVKRFAAGEVILEQDSGEDKRLYIVRSGKVKVVRKDKKT